MYIHKTTINNKKPEVWKRVRRIYEMVWKEKNEEENYIRITKKKRYIGLLKFPEGGEESVCIKSCNRRYFSTRVWVGRPRVSLSLGINWLVWC